MLLLHPHIRLHSDLIARRRSLQQQPAHILALPLAREQRLLLARGGDDAVVTGRANGEALVRVVGVDELREGAAAEGGEGLVLGGFVGGGAGGGEAEEGEGGVGEVVEGGEGGGEEVGGRFEEGHDVDCGKGFFKGRRGRCQLLSVDNLRFWRG